MPIHPDTRPARKLYQAWSRYSDSFPVAVHPSSRAQFWSLAARGARFNAQKLADHSQLNIRQIERHCREDLGRAPQEWLNEQRIVAARWLLLETDSVKKTAIELNFKQVSHFCREFKRFHGVTPSQFLLLWRRMNRKCR